MVIKRKVLVAGGTGFIGSHIINTLIKNEYEVISISRSNPNKERNNPKVDYIEFNLTNPITEKLINYLSRVEYIINCSGCIDHKGFDDGGSSIFKEHCLSVFNLTELALKLPLKTFIHLGSSDEYGETVSPINEGARESPISPYSLSKVTSSHYLQQVYRNRALPVVIIRPFLIFGESQKTTRFLPYIIKKCLKNESFGVTEGIQLRDYCYIEDFVSGIQKCLDNKKAYGEIINIASGVPRSIKEVTDKVIDIIGSGHANYGVIPFRNNESMSLYADITKANTLLEWTPKCNFERSLMKVINWYEVNSSYT